MTSPARALAILDLFTEEAPVWCADAINEALAYTRATGYRYVKDLVEAGLLQKISAGRYALGARIIELDYQLRRSDPVLLAAVPVMEALVKKTRLDAVLTTMLGQKVIDTFRASGDSHLQLGYGRGRPRPLLLGAAPKVIIAHLPRAQQVKIYETQAALIAKHKLAQDWVGFRTLLAEIRRAGFYLSHGELEAGIGAGAVPLLNGDGDVVAALALVGTTEALDTVGAAWLKARLDRAKSEIESRLLA